MTKLHDDNVLVNVYDDEDDYLIYARVMGRELVSNFIEEVKFNCPTLKVLNEGSDMYDLKVCKTPDPMPNELTLDNMLKEAKENTYYSSNTIQ